MTPALALAIWTRARDEEFGLVLTMSSPEDFENVREDLYKARQKARDLSLSNLSITRPGDNPSEIMVVKQTVSLEETAQSVG